MKRKPTRIDRARFPYVTSDFGHLAIDDDYPGLVHIRVCIHCHTLFLEEIAEPKKGGCQHRTSTGINALSIEDAAAILGAFHGQQYKIHR